MNIHINNLNIFESCCPGRGALVFSFGLPENKEENNMPVEVTLTNEQKVEVKLTPKTSTGKPASVDGAPKWSVTSGTAQVVAADDGLSAVIVSSDDPDDSTILVTADADLGAGVEEIADTIVVHTVHAKAANLGIAVGDPQPK